MNESVKSVKFMRNVFKRLGMSDVKGNKSLQVSTKMSSSTCAAAPATPISTPSSVVTTKSVGRSPPKPDENAAPIDVSTVERPDGDGAETSVVTPDVVGSTPKAKPENPAIAAVQVRTVQPEGAGDVTVVAGTSSGTVDARGVTGARPRRAMPDGQETGAVEKLEAAPVIEIEDKDKTKPKKSALDFIFGKTIGDGSFSTVYLAKDVHSSREFAIKVCDKRHIFREKKQKYIKQEKEVLNFLNDHSSPLFVKLYCTFQDVDRLYFVLTYAKKGELLPFIIRVGSFDDECCRFYTGEIVLALEHLHKHGIVHRDLKPENILLNENMHILVTDFGSARILEPRKDGDTTPQRRNSFVGTAQYVSPDVLNDKPATTSSDLWALGVILYQMVAGLPPFRVDKVDSSMDFNIFNKIQNLDYTFPDGFDLKAKDLVEKLLQTEASKRLGANDQGGTYTSIRTHEFFGGLDWDNLLTQKPPIIEPYLPGTPGNEELRSQYRIPDSLEPGFDDRHMSRLLSLDLCEEKDKENPAPVAARPPGASRRTSIMNFTPEEFRERLKVQEKENQWNPFVLGNLILKSGIVDKRRGLFSKRRMLLLTTGPRLFYVDPVHKVTKGEIPWSPQLRPETKNFKTFFVHTPNRTYYLEDPEGFALEWCRVIDEVRRHTYDQV